MSFEKAFVLLVAAASCTGIAASTAPASISGGDEGTCDAFAAGGECVRQAAPQGRALLQMKGHGPSALEAGSGQSATTAKKTALLAPLALVEGSAMDKFQELERRVQAMRKEGQDPVGVANWISNQLLPLANATKGQLQGEVNRAQQAVANCDAQLAAAENGAREQETTLSIGEARHQECELTHQQKAKDAEDDCAAVQSLCDTIQAPPSVSEVDLNDTDAVEDALQANFRFLEANYPTFNQESEVCMSATSLAEQQAQQCDSDQANLEASYCSLKTARQGICSDYSACFQEKKAQFRRVLADIREVESYTKTTYQTLTCQGRTFLQNGQACNVSSVDTTALDVFYPSEPNQESCSDEVSTSWNYSANLCDGIIVGGDEEEVEATPGNGTGNGTGNTSLVETGSWFGRRIL